MAYGLPEHGELGWDDKLLNSISAIKDTADDAYTKAVVAEGTASAVSETASTKAAEASASADAAALSASDASSSATAASSAAAAAEAVGATNDAVIASRINDTASATRAALSATIAAGVASRSAVVPVAGYNAVQADGTNIFDTLDGLTTSGDYFAASTDGSDASGYFARRANLTRIAFRVKCSKAVVGSVTSVGLVRGAPGDTTSHPNHIFGFGYKQGTGLAFVSAGAWQSAQVADSAITDGDEYDVSLLVDFAVSPTSGAGNFARVEARWSKSDGTGANWANLDINLDLFACGNYMVRTNVAAGAVTNYDCTVPAAAKSSLPSGGSLRTSPAYTNQTMFARLPASPNGLAVIGLHGAGGNDIQTGWTSDASAPTWLALEAMGYSVFCPDLGGDLWANNDALDLLAELHGYIVTAFQLDPNVFLWGGSMGAATVLTAIAKGIVPVRAARCVDSVCDLTQFWDRTPYSTTIQAAYDNDTALRDANNPIGLDASAFDVPILLSASPADTVAVKADNTDVFLAHIGGATDSIQLATTSGTHMTPENALPRATAQWFASHI